jgi:hypothetical protein
VNHFSDLCEAAVLRCQLAVKTRPAHLRLQKGLLSVSLCVLHPLTYTQVGTGRGTVDKKDCKHVKGRRLEEWAFT